LGLCYWLFSFSDHVFSSPSFFGNADGLITSSDQDAVGYDAPSFTLASGGGQDIITFSELGVYCLIFTIGVNFPSTSITPADISSNVTLDDCSCLGSTYNSGSLDSNQRVYSLGTFQASSGGTITFPDYTTLLTLYGSSWANSFCLSVSVVRLS